MTAAALVLVCDGIYFHIRSIPLVVKWNRCDVAHLVGCGHIRPLRILNRHICLLGGLSEGLSLA